MSADIGNQIFEFVQNRHEKGESTSPRHIHIRFGIEISQAEEHLSKLCMEGRITKYYDEDYQEYRYSLHL
jgi:hypothetical protein